jgi:hypothetical protein
MAKTFPSKLRANTDGHSVGGDRKAEETSGGGTLEINGEIVNSGPEFEYGKPLSEIRAEKKAAAIAAGEIPPDQVNTEPVGHERQGAGLTAEEVVEDMGIMVPTDQPRVEKLDEVDVPELFASLLAQDVHVMKRPGLKRATIIHEAGCRLVIVDEKVWADLAEQMMNFAVQMEEGVALGIPQEMLQDLPMMGGVLELLS